MGRLGRAGLVLAGMLAAAPGSATVIYTFTGTTGSFTYQSDDFVSGRTRVQATALDACSALPGQCGFVDFLPGAVAARDEVDFAALYYAGQPQSYTVITRYFVTPGALGRTGSYQAGGGNVLRVASVPEPATWLAMLAGFGAIGLALRRRRTGSATFAPR